MPRAASSSSAYSVVTGIVRNGGRGSTPVDRDKRDEESRDNSLSSKCIENNEAAKRDKDGVEETEDRARMSDHCWRWDI